MTETDQKIRAYYRERAPVYERVYDYPERQPDLRYFEDYLTRRFTNMRVLEVAAGTGYWTQYIAATACSVTATEVTESALAELNRRSLPATGQATWLMHTHWVRQAGDSTLHLPGCGFLTFLSNGAQSLLIRSMAAWFPARG